MVFRLTWSLIGVPSLSSRFGRNFVDRSGPLRVCHQVFILRPTDSVNKPIRISSGLSTAWRSAIYLDWVFPQYSPSNLYRFVTVWMFYWLSTSLVSLSGTDAVVPSALAFIRRCHSVWRKASRRTKAALIATRFRRPRYVCVQKVWLSTNDLPLKAVSHKLVPYVLDPGCGTAQANLPLLVGYTLLRKLRKFNLAQELPKQFYSAIIESVLCTSITVWFSLSYQIWPRRLQRVVRDCWANHWYNPRPSPRTVLNPEWAKELAKSLWTPHTQHTPSLNCCCLVDATELWMHQNDKAQKQFLPSGNPSHEHLTINVEHTTLLYIIYSSHILFYFKFARAYLYIHNCLYYIYCVFLFCTLPICILFLYYRCPFLSCCCHFAALWCFCHYSKFLICVNISGNKAHSHCHYRNIMDRYVIKGSHYESRTD